ncbi:MAG: hypothetical protein MUO76_21890, partial [Anaerolineaceae bacterium]|nr:hypothetical protein [Anaerolineaceae bacterium]
SDGQPMKMIDWYIGIAPTMSNYVRQQTEMITRAVHELNPDGVFLSFTRWPGFWELWTQEYQRCDFPEYSYDPISLGQFRGDTGVDVPHDDPTSSAAWIEDNAREAWTGWKCQKVVDVIRGVKEACNQERANTQIMLNTLPFGSDFDDAQEKVFGQNLKALSDVVDVFEVMTYHQILKRPVDWIAQCGEYVKRRTGKKTVCALQTIPLYLEGIHARKKRATRLDNDEFAQAVTNVEEVGLDGVVVFVWSNLLDMVLYGDDMRRIDAIRTAIDRRTHKAG